MTEQRLQALDLLKSLGITVDVDAFERDGCGIVRGFATAEECDEMRQSMKTLVEN